MSINPNLSSIDGELFASFCVLLKRYTFYVEDVRADNNIKTLLKIAAATVVSNRAIASGEITPPANTGNMPMTEDYFSSFIDAESLSRLRQRRDELLSAIVI